MKRIQMVRETSRFEVSSANKYKLAHLSPSDAQQLGELLYIAYKGTIDDEGASEAEAITEAIETLSGRYGNVIWEASMVLLDQDRFASVTVITDYAKANPLLAFTATHPNNQKQGLSAQLIQLSLTSLHKLNIPKLHLVVTEGNDPAIRLYRKLGFQEDGNG